MLKSFLQMLWEYLQHDAHFSFQVWTTFIFHFNFNLDFELGAEMQYDANDDHALLNMMTWHNQKGDYCS